MNDDKSNLDIEFIDEVHSANILESTLSESTLSAHADNRLAHIPHFLSSDSSNSTPQTIQHHLEGARRAIATAESGPHLASSPATATPVLGTLWGRIRAQMHDLVLFYVNRANVTHSRVDSQLIEAINSLTQLVEAQQAEIDQLKERLLEKQHKDQA